MNKRYCPKDCEYKIHKFILNDDLPLNVVHGCHTYCTRFSRLGQFDELFIAEDDFTSVKSYKCLKENVI